MASQKPKINITKDIVDGIATRFNFQGNLDELKMGLEVEQEHYDVVGLNLENIARIALAHLDELPDYYTRLEAMENEAKGVVPETEPEDQEFGEINTEEDVDIEPQEEDQQEGTENNNPNVKDEGDIEFNIEDLAGMASKTSKQEITHVGTLNTIKTLYEILSPKNKQIIHEIIVNKLNTEYANEITKMLNNIMNPNIVKDAKLYINNEDIILTYMDFVDFSNSPQGMGGTLVVKQIGWEDLPDLTNEALGKIPAIKKFDIWDLDNAISFANKKGKFLGLIPFNN